MCKYCEQNILLKTDNEYNNESNFSNKIDLSLLSNNLKIESYVDYNSPLSLPFDDDEYDMFSNGVKTIKTVKIKYCPFCGKKLSDILKDKYYYLVIKNDKDDNYNYYRVKLENKPLNYKDELLVLKLKAKYAGDIYNTYFKCNDITDFYLTVIQEDEIESFISICINKYKCEIIEDNRNE